MQGGSGMAFKGNIGSRWSQVLTDHTVVLIGRTGIGDNGGRIIVCGHSKHLLKGGPYFVDSSVLPQVADAVCRDNRSRGGCTEGTTGSQSVGGVAVQDPQPFLGKAPVAEVEIGPAQVHHVEVPGTGGKDNNRIGIYTGPLDQGIHLGPGRQPGRRCLRCRRFAWRSSQLAVFRRKGARDMTGTIAGSSCRHAA